MSPGGGGIESSWSHDGGGELQLCKQVTNGEHVGGWGGNDAKLLGTLHGSLHR